MPENLKYYATHSNAFDRIFLCDYMFNFVDSIFRSLMIDNLAIKSLQRYIVENDSVYTDEHRISGAPYHYLVFRRLYVHQGCVKKSDVEYVDKSYDLDGQYNFHMASRTAKLFSKLIIEACLFKSGKMEIKLCMIFAKVSAYTCVGTY